MRHLYPQDKIHAHVQRTFVTREPRHQVPSFQSLPNNDHNDDEHDRYINIDGQLYFNPRIGTHPHFPMYKQKMVPAGLIPVHKEISICKEKGKVQQEYEEFYCRGDNPTKKDSRIIQSTMLT